MSSYDITAASLAEALSNLGRKPEPSLNITPVVLDWGNQDNHRLLALASAARAIAETVCAGRGYGKTVKQSEFDALKAFVQYADGDFALIGICRSERDVDELPIGASRKRYDEDEVWK